MTRGRAGELEQRLAALEASLHTRVDELERELAEARALSIDLVRAQAAGLLEVLRDAHTKALRVPDHPPTRGEP